MAQIILFTEPSMINTNKNNGERTKKLDLTSHLKKTISFSGSFPLSSRNFVKKRPLSKSMPTFISLGFSKKFNLSSIWDDIENDSDLMSDMRSFRVYILGFMGYLRTTTIKKGLVDKLLYQNHKDKGKNIIVAITQKCLAIKNRLYGLKRLLFFFQQLQYTLETEKFLFVLKLKDAKECMVFDYLKFAFKMDYIKSALDPENRLLYKKITDLIKP